MVCSPDCRAIGRMKVLVICEVKMDSKSGFRYAERKDVPLILDFIKALAEYERMSDEVVADEKLLEEWIFDKQKAEVIFAVVDKKRSGICLIFS